MRTEENNPHSMLVLFVKWGIRIVALALLAIVPSISSQISGLSGQSRWYWFRDCHGGKMMGLEMLLNGKSIYHLEFHACLMEDGDSKSDSQQRIQVFHMPGGHTFQGTHHTSKREKIEGNIWQAGADPDALWLGLSIASNNQVLLNTIHIARLGKATQSELDPGLVVRTYPLRLAAIPSPKR